MLVDSHCHLDQFADADAVLAAAVQAGVGQVVAVSESADSMRSVLALKRRYPDQVLAGLGLHPAWITQATDGRTRRRTRLSGGASARGRCPRRGRPRLQMGDQSRSAGPTARSPRLSNSTSQHSAVSRSTCTRVAPSGRPWSGPWNLGRRTKLNAQLHWFTQSKKLVRICRAERIYVSVGPSVLCDPQTQAVVAEIDRELLLLETDAPVPIGGSAGHPARVAAVADKLAELIGFTEEEAAGQLGALFGQTAVKISTLWEILSAQLGK